MAEMVEWSALLKKEGLSEILCTKVVSTYRSPDEFRSCSANADHLEQYIKGLLTLGEAPLATADDWGFHDEVQKSGFWPLAGPGLGMVTSRLTGADREEMVKRFTKNYPGVVLH